MTQTEVINMLNDQMVIRNQDQYGHKIYEWDMWFQGNYIGTIIKKGFTYWVDDLSNVHPEFSLQAAILRFVEIAVDTTEVEVIVNPVATEAPEATIFNFVKGLLK